MCAEHGKAEPNPWQLRRMFVGGIGGGLLLAGIICIVLPIPATPIIVTGLVILATEFDWPEKLLKKIPQWINWLRGKKLNQKTITTIWFKRLVAAARKVALKF